MWLWSWSTVKTMTQQIARKIATIASVTWLSVHGSPFHWMARSPCKDGSLSLIASEEPADDALSERKVGFAEDGCLAGNSRPGLESAANGYACAARPPA